MNTTTNYGLNKPEANDAFDKSNDNENMDIIDARMKANADAAVAAQAAADAAETPAGAQAKADAAEAAAKAYADAGIADLAGMGRTAETVKGNADALAAHQADYTMQVPYGGTATNSGNNYAISSPTIPVLSAGMAVSFKCNADSSGAATLNWNSKGAKNIKKANGANVTNLKNGGIYTLRYDGANFILQGEGGEYGTATAPDVLAGKTVGTETGIISGTMPNRAGDTAALASSVTGTTLKLRASQGYRDGVDDTVTITDANFVAANILSGKNIFGLSGSAPIKLVASGVKAADTVGKLFKTDGGSPITQRTLVVTGLAFKPFLIVATVLRTDKSSNFASLYYELGFSNYNDLIYPCVTTRASIDNYAGSVWVLELGNPSGYVNSTGFELPVGTTTNVEYTWYAFGG